MDIQSSKTGWKAYPHQNGPTSNSCIYDVCVSNPQRHPTKNQSHPERFPMERSKGQKEMGLCGVGQGVQTEEQRGPRVIRPTGNQRGIQGKVVVEMGKAKLDAMGKYVES